MKPSLIVGLMLCPVLLITACRGLPKYTGDGQISNTTTWHDGVVRIPEYTIRLNSFCLNTNLAQTFDLDSLDFFRATTIKVVVRFTSCDRWVLFGENKANEMFAAYGWRCLDDLTGRLAWRVVTDSGQELMASDQLLKNYTWGQSQLGGSLNRVEVYDGHNSCKEIPPGHKLKLIVSYVGDSILTNRAELLVLCRSK